MEKAMFKAAVVILSTLAICSGAWAENVPEALSFEAAFDRAEISTPAVLSPDGVFYAAEVVRTPPNHDVARASNISDSLLPSGKPVSALGVSVCIGKVGNDGVVPVMVGADSWRPSWSPDGTHLAFYSDADGITNLWIFDVETRESRRISDAYIKARPLSWRGAHAQWASDGKSVYVHLKPVGQPPPKVAALEDQRKSDAADGVSVFVFRSVDERVDSTSGDRNTSLEDDTFNWMNNADLAEINIETGAVRQVVSSAATPRPSVMRLSPSGRWLSYLSVFYLDKQRTGYESQLDLSVVRADQSAEEQSMVLSRGLPVFSPYYLNSYRWHPFDDRIVFFKEKELWTQDFRGQAFRPAQRLNHDGLGLLAENVILFTRGGKEVLVAEFDRAGQRDNSDTLRGIGLSTFQLVPLDGGVPKRLPFDSERWEYVSFLTVNDSVLWQPDSDAAFIHVRDKMTSDNVILRVALRDGSESEHFRWSGGLSHINGDLSHSKIIAVLESMDIPPDLYWFDDDISKRGRLTSINSQLSGVALGESRIMSVTVPRYDGALQRVNVGVVMPPGAHVGDKVPAIVVFYPDFDYSAQEMKKFMGGIFPVPWGLFTSRGYAVVFAHVLAGPGGTKGDILKDVTDSLLPQVYALSNAGYIDVNRLALTGNSFAGFSTAGIASRTNLFRAVIPQNGPYDISGAGYGAFRDPGSSANFWQRWLERSQPRIGDHPWADLRRVIDNSPYYQADKIVTPMLILQGGDDYFVQDAQMMYTALTRLNRTVELAVYEGSGHALSAWPQPNAIDGTKRMLRFLEQHLGPGFSIVDDD